MSCFILALSFTIRDRVSDSVPKFRYADISVYGIPTAQVLIFRF